jgi:signal transduction histidine kinase
VLRLVDLSLYSVQRKVEVEEWAMDRTLMEHALLNLVSNARKFAASGVGVGVRKTRKAGTVDEDELELWVWNDGAIISHGDRQEIFKPGKQTDEGKKAGGHGLGLSIVKSIAERHHGRVIVDSHEKIGTTFRIFIPEQEMSVKPAAPKPVLVEQTDTVPELLNKN